MHKPTADPSSRRTILSIFVILLPLLTIVCLLLLLGASMLPGFLALRIRFPA